MAHTGACCGLFLSQGSVACAALMQLDGHRRLGGKQDQQVPVGLREALPRPLVANRQHTQESILKE